MESDPNADTKAELKKIITGFNRGKRQSVVKIGRIESGKTDKRLAGRGQNRSRQNDQAKVQEEWPSSKT